MGTAAPSPGSPVVSFSACAGRLARLRGALVQEDLDGVFLLVREGQNWESAVYLSGYRGTSAALLVSRDEEILITDGRYLVQARSQSPFSVVEQGNRSLVEAAGEEIRRLRLRRVGFEAERVSLRVYREMESRCPVEWVDRSDLLPLLRRIKDEQELRLIEEAARKAAGAFMETLGAAGPGMSEREFAALLEYRLQVSGAEGGWGSHSFIVASGPRSALPHGTPTERRFAPGEWFTVDFGARYEGYVCDITRNVAVGTLDPWARDLHELLVAAQDAAAEALRVGVSGREVDRVARSLIEQAGWGEAFSHGLGHGIGLELHEAPRVSPRGEGILEAGDVVTLEPGVYVEGRGGLRVEDDYVLRLEGPDRITQALPREFFVLR